MYRGTDSREALVAIERRSSRDTVRSHATSVGESLYASTVLSLGEQETRRRGAKPLNDQQWVLQRKRIGLSRKSMKTLQASLDTQKVKMTAITYIETHFNRKECMKFLASSPSSPHCHCGSLASGHTTGPQEDVGEVQDSCRISQEDIVDSFLPIKPSDNWSPALAVQVGVIFPS